MRLLQQQQLLLQQLLQLLILLLLLLLLLGFVLGENGWDPRMCDPGGCVIPG